MQELTFEQVEEVSGGVAWLAPVAAVLTVIAAVDAAVDAY
ncbi:class IIb bacteriocin, lactobin A/cerein 7B family [Rheinheimera sp. D18]|nr:class IIb bacteriocin, lactobin A/cerein 7B family [Rheinheimera sp. D18]QBL10379.1 class IIb bacteriocin, lactobin A/cerein 7B family [Rheinheimera sp. D18]